MDDREVLEKFDELCREAEECVEECAGSFACSHSLLESLLKLKDDVRETLEQEACFEQSREDHRLMNDERCGG